MSTQTLFTRRRFIQGAAASAAIAGGGYYLLRPEEPKSDAKADVLIVGGGAAGISIASRLRRALPNAQMTIVDPSADHYYQPGFTLVAGGVISPNEIVRPQSSLIPDGVRWVRDSVTTLDPDSKRVETAAHGSMRYDFLVLCPGCR